jgi:hypothetical protein
MRADLPTGTNFRPDGIRSGSYPDMRINIDVTASSAGIDLKSSRSISRGRP